MSTTYAITWRETILGHSGGAPLLLKDGLFEAEDKQDREAHIRSGDYFEMLATKLDTISDTLPEQNEAERVYLQRLAEDLLHLQRKYKIVKKA